MKGANFNASLKEKCVIKGISMLQFLVSFSYFCEELKNALSETQWLEHIALDVSLPVYAFSGAQSSGTSSMIQSPSWSSKVALTSDCRTPIRQDFGGVLGSGLKVKIRIIC